MKKQMNKRIWCRPTCLYLIMNNSILTWIGIPSFKKNTANNWFLLIWSEKILEKVNSSKNILYALSAVCQSLKIYLYQIVLTFRFYFYQKSITNGVFLDINDWNRLKYHTNDIFYNTMYYLNTINKRTSMMNSLGTSAIYVLKWFDQCYIS